MTRDLDRDQRYLESEEKKLVIFCAASFSFLYFWLKEAEVRAAAKRGDEASARILAKQLVKLREQKQKTMMMKSNVTSAGYQAQVRFERCIFGIHVACII